MPFPIIAALGLAGSALSAISLIKNIAKAGEKPDPATIAKAIEDKAILLSRKEGIPMEQAKAAVAEQTTKEVQSEYGFDPTAAVFETLGLVPGVGLLAKGASVAKAAGTGLKAGITGAARAQGGMKTMLGGMGKASEEEGANAIRIAAREGKGVRPGQTSKMPMKKSTPGEEAAEVANPAMRAAHGAEEAGEYGSVYGGPGSAAKAYRGVAEDVGETAASRVAHGAEEMGEYGGRSAMASPKMDPAFAREYPSGTGFTMLESADPANALSLAPPRGMIRSPAPAREVPLIGMGQQNFKTVDVPYEVISPPYNPTLGLPFDEAAAMDEMFRNRLGGIYAQQVRRFPLISDEGRSRATAIMANLQNG